MSGWTLTIPSTKRALFEDAVDRTRPKGDTGSVDLDAIRASMKAMAKLVKRPFISAQAGGDCKDDHVRVDVFGDPAADEVASLWN